MRSLSALLPKIVVIGLSTEDNEQQALWPLTTGNKKKFNIDYAVF